MLNLLQRIVNSLANELLENFIAILCWVTIFVVTLTSGLPVWACLVASFIVTSLIRDFLIGAGRSFDSDRVNESFSGLINEARLALLETFGDRAVAVAVGLISISAIVLIALGTLAIVWATSHI